MRSRGSPLWRLLPAAGVLVTASCGVSATGTIAPGGSATSTATASSAEPPTASAMPNATHTGSAGATAEIFGVVQAGPSCPVDPVYHACRPRPLGHVEVQARSPSAGLVASARTQADGHYTLHLGPGSYVLAVVTTEPFPKCPHTPVSIGSGAAIRANITCDTGIRQPGPPGPPATNPA
jgi:hypothetical protein